MSVLQPRQLWRVARTATFSQRVLFTPITQQRYYANPLSSWWQSRKERQAGLKHADNPLTEEYLTRKPKQNRPQAGGLASTSIFEDEAVAGDSAKQVKPAAGKGAVRNPEHMAAVLDPDPSNRKRWERKMVMRSIRKRGRLTRKEQIKQTERELTSPSHLIKTSIKKLMPLAHQIAGKTVEEAIVQMRFSKKKAARAVKDHLEYARNEAIVRRGMGLGRATGEKEQFTPMTIHDKDGKKLKIEDPTGLYVDQAWVGKGHFTKSMDFRARGRAFILKHPTTRVTVVLKEEKTRIRQHEEREKKLANRKLWTQLPNRPVTAQRQHYSW